MQGKTAALEDQVEGSFALCHTSTCRIVLVVPGQVDPVIEVVPMVKVLSAVLVAECV